MTKTNYTNRTRSMQSGTHYQKSKSYITTTLVTQPAKRILAVGWYKPSRIGGGN